MIGIGMGSGELVANESDPYARERDAWAVLASVHGLGPIGFAALLQSYGSAQDVLAEASRPHAADRFVATPPADIGLRKRPIDDAVARRIVVAAENGARILARLRSLDVRVVTVEEPSYPVRLGAIAMPPHVLYVQGRSTALAAERAVAVVGTRRATSTGRDIAARIATALVAADATVVSGLAFGIDGAAHAATLRADGTTVAVIGGGHAMLGPAAHRRLADAIIERGGAIVSELAADVEPTQGTFPQRNRIISGLTDATIVVEAPAKSGALITASWALEQGRGCFLVPGPLDSRTSAGSLAFLREFAPVAQIVTGITQLIADLGFTSQLQVPGDAVVMASLQQLGRTETLIASALLGGLATVDELVAATDLPIATVLAALTLLQRKGLVTGAHGRYRPAGAMLGEQRVFWKGADESRRRVVARAGHPLLT
ncbi:MAG TPA: DNA-processing protein DprA [Candidatus Limnocylindrales bacterium]|nr:DNA-processing protein DprA [Candidatus Limnocylindrales bacterium]